MNEKRIVFLITVIVVLASVILARLVQLQIIKGEGYRRKAENIRLKMTLIHGQRATILDRNGIELAKEIPVWELHLNYWLFTEPRNILQRLEYLGKDNSGFDDKEYAKLVKILTEIAKYRANRSIPRSKRFFDTWRKRQHPLVKKEIRLTLQRLAELIKAAPEILFAKLERVENEINSVFNIADERIADRYLKIVRLGASVGFWDDLARKERRSIKDKNLRKYQDNPLVLASEIDTDTLETIEELEWLFPGATGVPKLKRIYPQTDCASHLLGYVREIERVGDHHPIPVDVRIIAATNRDLQKLMEEGAFRRDLYYRLHVFPIRLPALRERREDIPLLVDYFVGKFNASTGKQIAGVEPEAIKLLMDYEWPGNVRELENAIEHAFVLCNEGTIRPFHLPEEILRVNLRPTTLTPPQPLGQESRQRNRRDAILDALRKTHWHRGNAAKLLGVSRVTLWKWMKKYGLNENTAITLNEPET